MVDPRGSHHLTRTYQVNGMAFHAVSTGIVKQAVGGVTHARWRRGAAWYAVRPWDGSGQSGPRGHIDVSLIAMMVEPEAMNVTELLHESVSGPYKRVNAVVDRWAGEMGGWAK